MKKLLVLLVFIIVTVQKNYCQSLMHFEDSSKNFHACLQSIMPNGNITKPDSIMLILPGPGKKQSRIPVIPLSFNIEAPDQFTDEMFKYWQVLKEMRIPFW